jgi:fatty acid-binding protein DegV
VQTFLRTYQRLETEFDAILVLTLSAQLVPAAQIAREAALQHGGKAHIAVLDSWQTGSGLGVLAKLGAQAILDGVSLAELQNYIRATAGHVYTLIHAEAGSLALCQAGMQDAGSLPLLALEGGQLISYKQIRTKRHLVESFQEFVEEFETPQQISLLRGRYSPIRARLLRETAAEQFPQTPFGDAEMPAPLARLFGSQAAAITVMELPKR